MRHIKSMLGAAAAVLGLLLLSAGAGAQELKQMQLTDKQVESFIAAQKDFAPLASKLLEGGEKLTDEIKGELEAVAKKHGFASFSEYEDVGANISIVLEGLDRKSGAYTDPVDKMKKELEDIKADTSIPKEDKDLAIDDLNQEIAAAQPLQFKDNVEIVKKHRDAIEKLIPEEGDMPEAESKPSSAAASDGPVIDDPQAGPGDDPQAGSDPKDGADESKSGD